jgi:hypothetical protein
MDKDTLKLQQSLNSFENENEQETKNEKNENSFLDNMGFDAFFTLIDDDNDNMQTNNNEINESENNNNKEDIDYKISIDLSDIKNTKIHNYLNEELMPSIKVSMNLKKINVCQIYHIMKMKQIILKIICQMIMICLIIIILI